MTVEPRATGTTPRYALPYPDANEPVAGGAAAMQALAAALDGKLGLIVDSGKLAAPAANIDLTSIPATFTHLRLYLQLRTTGVTAGNQEIRLMVNGDANAANYPTGAGSASNTLGFFLGYAALGSAAASVFGGTVVDIPFYRDAALVKALLGYGVGGNPFGIGSASGYWAGVAAINRLTITPAGGQWAAGSRAILYGVF